MKEDTFFYSPELYCATRKKKDIQHKNDIQQDKELKALNGDLCHEKWPCLLELGARYYHVFKGYVTAVLLEKYISLKGNMGVG